VFTAAIAVILASVVIPLVATISVMLWSNFFNITREYRGRQYRTPSAAEVGYVYLGLLILVYTEFRGSSADSHPTTLANYVSNNTLTFIVSLFWFCRGKYVFTHTHYIPVVYFLSILHVVTFLSVCYQFQNIIHQIILI
jgi:hypothetical protein